MAIRAGSQVVLCDLPIRVDTYKGCSHACAYCFVKRKMSISDTDVDNCVKQVQRFIAGERKGEYSWCDWKIPLHWGGVSDPFQPAEKQHRASLKLLELFAETQYPFVVSTKGRLVIEDPYLTLLSKSNAVVQISMVCSKYDKLERGSTTYEERLEMARTLAPRVKRVIARVQPYMLEVFDDVCANIPKLAEAGVHGITIEGMKFVKKKDGMVKVGGDFCYPEHLLKHDFEILRDKCHKHGMSFYCAENRLRSMGDDMCCCGVDGLPGFQPNNYNLSHLLNGEAVQPTARMKERGTGYVFKTLNQTREGTAFAQNNSFKTMMLQELQKKAKK